MIFPGILWVCSFKSKATSHVNFHILCSHLKGRSPNNITIESSQPFIADLSTNLKINQMDTV